MDATQLMNFADSLLAGEKPSKIVAAAFNVGRQQIVVAYANALSEAVASGNITEDCVMAITERAVELFAQRGA